MPNLKQIVDKEFVKLEEIISLKKAELAALEQQRVAIMAYVKALNPGHVLEEKEYGTKKSTVLNILKESTNGGMRYKDIKIKMMELGFDETVVRNNVGPALYSLQKSGEVEKNGPYYSIIEG